MTKAALRQQYKQKRATLSEQEHHTLSQQLTDKLLASGLLQNCRYLHLYLPISRLREINTYLLADALRQQSPDMQLVLPVMDAEQGTLEHLCWESSTQFKANEWAIPEPQTGQKILSQQLDIVIVPLLAYDIAGHRLGYGKGFYDRFLAQCPEAVKIGLSFFEPEQAIPHEPHDIALDYCLSPSGIHQFT